MNKLKLINEIIKKGECFDVYKIKNITYYKISYNNIDYLISEKNNSCKIEEEI